MRFLNDLEPPYDLTYSDVFMVPSLSTLNSRFEVNLVTPDAVGTSVPLIVANMNAVAGKRMAETVARRGGLTVLPQDLPLDVLKEMVKYIKSRHLIYETPLTLGPKNTVAEALNIINKRAHEAVLVVDKAGVPLGIFKEKDSLGIDRFTQLEKVMATSLVSVPEGMNPKKIFETLHNKHVTVAPVLKNGKVIGLVTQKGALRSGLYSPATDKKGRLLVAAAIGINGDVARKAKDVVGLGVDILILDTAHGHQKKMIDAVKAVRKALPKTTIAAGNVVTSAATKDLISAGADIIKIGVGPGAMCTTRMATGVGRPQFSAVLECAEAARQLGKHVWADGGIRYPRDVALALAAGASNVMFGSWWAGTYESAADMLQDNQGQLYKENFGMASRRAVKNRGSSASAFDQAQKEFFEEGINLGKSYLNPERPGAEDLIDHIVAGVRSSLAYAGARNILQFQEKAVVGVQSAAGYQEGQALEKSWA